MSKETEIPDLTGKKILIIRLSSLGDILLTTPLLRGLKLKYRDIKIECVIKEQYRDTLKLNPHISKLFMYEKDKEKSAALISGLKQNKYDAVIDLQNNFRSMEIRRALRTATFIFNKRAIDKFLLVNFKINRLRKAPQIPLRYAAAVPGLELDDGGLELHTHNSPSSSLENHNNLIGIAPGSRHFTKMWPVKYYEKLGSKLRESGFDIALMGGEEDMAVCSELSERIPGSINVCFGDDLLQTAADLKKCKAIICNDSGMMHTACAVRIPVMAIYGSTVKEFGFTPYKNRNLILENNSLTCRPCSHIGRERCPKGHFRCMLDLTPEMAYEELMTLLKS